VGQSEATRRSATPNCVQRPASRRELAAGALPAVCNPTCRSYRWSVCRAPNSGHHRDPPPSVRHPATSPSSPLYPALPIRFSRAQTASNLGRQVPHVRHGRSKKKISATLVFWSLVKDVMNKLDLVSCSFCGKPPE
jgi:hypothetical protein